jgi:hypothetical protein
MFFDNVWSWFLTIVDHFLFFFIYQHRDDNFPFTDIGIFTVATTLFLNRHFDLSAHRRWFGLVWPWGLDRGHRACLAVSIAPIYIKFQLEWHFQYGKLTWSKYICLYMEISTKTLSNIIKQHGQTSSNNTTQTSSNTLSTLVTNIKHRQQNMVTHRQNT